MQIDGAAAHAAAGTDGTGALPALALSWHDIHYSVKLPRSSKYALVPFVVSMREWR